MISDYLDTAMKRAHYEIIEDEEPFYGEISECQGVWATGANLEQCRHNLLEALEGWLTLGLQRGLPIPAIEDHAPCLIERPAQSCS